MNLSPSDMAAITFDHLLTFMAQCDLGDVRMDTLKLRDLISTSIARSTRADGEQKFLIAALEYLHTAIRTVDR